MTLAGQSPRSSNIVQRAMNIILRPTAEWQVIDGEPATIQGLFTGYAMILAAIGPVCSLVGGLLFTNAALARVGVVISPVGLIINALLSYVATLLATYVFGLVIDMLAPNFGASRDRLRAMKVAVYSATPMWLAGVFGLVPLLAFLALLGLYGIFLLYKGQAIVMRAPADKLMGYTAVTVVVMLVIWIIIGAVVGSVAMATGASPGFGAFMHPAAGTSVTTVTTTN